MTTTPAFPSLRTDLSTGLCDAHLVAAVAETLAVPRAEMADSFVLHAPLELAARAALLPFVRPSGRDDARRRIVEVAEQFDAFGPPVRPPAPARFESTAEAAQRLTAAIDRGELDDVDAASQWLGRVAQAAELVRLLAPAVVPRLAAAAHAPIFLYQLPRVAPRGEISGELLRGLARELARFPEWRLEWIEGSRTEASADALFDAIRTTPALGVPGSTFILPVMSQVDASGVAARQLAPVTGGDDINARSRVLLRSATLSMLQEPPEHAAYGWSHCLTMPQAVLGLADVLPHRSDALTVAATYVVGFRAALAAQPLVAAYEPADPELAVPSALAADPATAAAAVFHASADAHDDIVTELATRASCHEDAHLAKYTLACLDAAAADPPAQQLYLAAAAYLVARWQA